MADDYEAERHNADEGGPVKSFLEHLYQNYFLVFPFPKIGSYLFNAGGDFAYLLGTSPDACIELCPAKLLWHHVKTFHFFQLQVAKLNGGIKNGLFNLFDSCSAFLVHKTVFLLLFKIVIQI